MSKTSAHAERARPSESEGVRTAKTVRQCLNGGKTKMCQPGNPAHDPGFESHTKRALKCWIYIYIYIYIYNTGRCEVLCFATHCILQDFS